MDKNIEDAIKKTAMEAGVTEFKVQKIVENVFNFLPNSMNKCEFEKYRIPLFGSFSIIKKRYEHAKEKKLNKLNNKK